MTRDDLEGEVFRDTHTKAVAEPTEAKRPHPSRRGAGPAGRHCGRVRQSDGGAAPSKPQRQVAKLGGLDELFEGPLLRIPIHLDADRPPLTRTVPQLQVEAPGPVLPSGGGQLYLPLDCISLVGRPVGHRVGEEGGHLGGRQVTELLSIEPGPQGAGGCVEPGFSTFRTFAIGAGTE